MALNKAVIMGRLVRDPDIRATQDGKSVARFTVAVDRFRRGDQRETDFIGCVAFGKSAEFVEKYFKKGDGIVVDGGIRTDSYTNAKGEKVYTTNIVVLSVEFPVSAPKNDTSSKTEEEQMGIPEGFEALTDDDVPF